MLKYRKIKADDDEVLAGIIRANLETLHLKFEYSGNSIF